MWKDFFYFSKGQRAGIITLLLLILIVIAAEFCLPYFFPVVRYETTTLHSDVDKFRRSLVSLDSIRRAEWQRRSEERQREYEENYRKFPAYTQSDVKAVHALFSFDPNKADSATFVRLGIKSFVASNILKYRNKGGKFRTPDDFSKVYGISSEKFAELKPYIAIQSDTKFTNDSISAKSKNINQHLIVELNTADTAQLMQVKGIGRGYARSIVRFRKEAGGFVSVEQLKEIYGMSPENYERIRPSCIVNASLVNKLKVNIATEQKLNSHPYLNFYQAKAIYELRRNRGKLKNISELNRLTEFTPEQLERIKPYLSFE